MRWNILSCFRFVVVVDSFISTLSRYVTDILMIQSLQKAEIDSNEWKINNKLIYWRQRRLLYWAHMFLIFYYCFVFAVLCEKYILINRYFLGQRSFIICIRVHGIDKREWPTAKLYILCFMAVFRYFFTKRRKRISLLNYLLFMITKYLNI